MVRAQSGKSGDLTISMKRLYCAETQERIVLDINEE